MKMLVTCMCVVVGLAAPARTQEPGAEKKPIRLLLITGRDVAAHDWRKTTPVLREHLEKSGRFEVVVSEEPLVLESSALDGYDAILLNYFNWQRPTLSDKAKQNLLGFVKGGKGLTVFHFSVRAFEEWTEYRNLVGRVWVTGSGHGPRGPFKVNVKDKGHAITRGMSDFEADDELYAKLVGDAKINVLIAAESDWSNAVEPLAWTLDYGKGRVFTTVLGHDAKACEDANFGRLLVRGTEWAARGEVK